MGNSLNINMDNKGGNEQEKIEDITDNDDFIDISNLNYSEDNQGIIENGADSQVADEEDQPAEEGSNKDTRNIIIMVVAIIAIFFIVLGGFKFYGNVTGSSVSNLIIDVDQLHEMNRAGKLDESRGYIYNDFSFVEADGLWWTEIYVYGTLTKVPLHYGPLELENVTSSGQLDEQFNNGEEVYIAINPDINYNGYYTLSLMELTNNVIQGLNREIITACTHEAEVCEERPVVSCDNKEGKPVIELFLDNETGIEFSGTCIKIKGQEQELVRATDRLLYHWYAIMD